MNPTELATVRELLDAASLRDFRKVIAPDHPLVFKGPDVLLSTPGNICAIFVPTFEERHSPAHLAARLIAARLAYPSATRCFLMWDRLEPLETSLTQDFDVTISLQNREVIDLLRAPTERRRRQPDSDGFRTEIIQRFDRALRASLLSYKWQRRFAFDEMPTSGRERYSWKDRPGLSSHGPVAFRELQLQQRDRFYFREVPVILADHRSRIALQKRTKATADMQFVSDFGLDNGTPHMRSSKIAVLVADRWSDQFDETSKLVVAAAFAGIAIAPASDPDIVENFIEKIPTLRSSTPDGPVWTLDDE